MADSLKTYLASLDSPFFLGPMAGFTDSVFRYLCHRQGCPLAYSEMLSAKGLYYKSPGGEEIARIQDREGPVALQLFGSEPEMFRFAVRHLKDSPSVFFDINMGCPVPKVVKNGEGSALMRNPKLAAECVRAAAETSDRPVTVKIRKGFAVHPDAGDMTGPDFARLMEDSGAAAIAVHGRTREEYYGGKADWDSIKAVKQAVSVPVIGSGDVFTADYQTAGRGRLDHKWLSPPGTNLMMSVVLSVDGLAPEQAATLPLVAGLAVAKAISRLMVGDQDLRRKTEAVKLKWPNDVLVGGKKIAGILCERNGDNVIVGIGVNVGQTEFDREIADRATSLALVADVSRLPSPVLSARTAILCELDRWYSRWREKGFAAVHPEIAAVDLLRGRTVSVRQNDGDSSPIIGVSNGIMGDGSLDVGGVKVYAGEAHVEKL